MHGFGHDKRWVLIGKISKAVENSRWELLEEVMRKEEGNEWVECNGHSDEIVNGSLDQTWRVEGFDGCKILQSITNELHVFLTDNPVIATDIVCPNGHEIDRNGSPIYNAHIFFFWPAGLKFGELSRQLHTASAQQMSYM